MLITLCNRANARQRRAIEAHTGACARRCSLSWGRWGLMRDRKQRADIFIFIVARCRAAERIRIHVYGAAEYKCVQTHTHTRATDMRMRALTRILFNSNIDGKHQRKTRPFIRLYIMYVLYGGRLKIQMSPHIWRRWLNLARVHRRHAAAAD